MSLHFMTHVVCVRAVLCGGTSLHLQDKRATLHRVDEDVAALEERVAGPRPDEVDLATAAHIVILGVDIEEADLLHTVLLSVHS